MKNIAAILLLVVISFACNTERNDVANLKDEVMLIHDDAKPKMAQVAEVQEKLILMADSSVSDTVVAQTYRNYANSLQLANESMLDWMRRYDPNFDGREDAVKEYLNRKKEEIVALNIQTDSVLLEAQTLLMDLDNLEKQVMEIHDEVMPKMGDLRSVRKKLQERADVTDDGDAYRQAASNIDAANEAMMDWMRNYDPNFEGSEAEVRAYLIRQRQKIQEVNRQMNSALGEGEQLLN